MNEHSIITNFYKQFVHQDADKTKILRALLAYVLEVKLESKDYAMLSKLIKDFGPDIVFDSLVSFRYSNVDQSKNIWGYLTTICKNTLKNSVIESNDDKLIEETKDLLLRLKERISK